MINNNLYYNKKKYLIKDIKAREILDSRGIPTIEVDVYTEKTLGRSSVPSGTSKGKFECIEKRDKNKKRYFSNGVLNAIDIINSKIKKLLVGIDVREQRLIDKLMIDMDNSKYKKNLGSHAILIGVIFHYSNSLKVFAIFSAFTFSILSISLGVAKAASNTLEIPLYRYLGGVNTYKLPLPLFNIINGGKHAGNNLSFQEFMICPICAHSFKEALEIGSKIYKILGLLIKKNYGLISTNVGYEGGYAPNINNNIEALNILTLAIEEAGYSKKEIRISIDVAASELYNSNKKKYFIDNNYYYYYELYDYYKNICYDYNIFSIEDPFHENAFIDFKILKKKLNHTMVIGDDLFATNIDRIKKGIYFHSADCLLVKMNQIGSISETFDASLLSIKNNMKICVSHRSGETEDTTIADLSVALGSSMIKSGAPFHGERIAKYNQLLRIEEELGDIASIINYKLL